MLNNSHNNINKKNVSIAITIVFIIAVVLIGSYALTLWNSSQNTELTMRIGNIAGVYFDNGPNINVSDIGPVLDYEKDGEKTNFSVANFTKEELNVTASLKITTISDNLKKEDFKYAVMASTDNVTYTKINEGSFVNSSNGTTIELVKAHTLSPTGNAYFKVIIYIDGNMENSTTIQGGSLNAVISVSANSSSWGTTSIDNSGANAPAYTEGLIPVMYDETTNKWVKADTTSSTSEYGWYDYDNKKWANAVLIENKDIAVVNEINKNVSINNAMSTSYSGTFSDKFSYYSYKPLKMTFTTGASGGTLSFDYTGIINDMWDSSVGLEILLNGVRTYYPVSDYSCETGTPDYGTNCSDTKNFSSQLEPNTKYTLEIAFELGDLQGTNIEIYGISLPNDLTEGLSVSGGECAYEGGNCGNAWVGNDPNNVVYSYFTISDEGKFILGEDYEVLAEGKAALGNYICSDKTLTECTEIYQIKEVNNNIITKVDTYTTESISQSREILKTAKAGTVIPEDIILAYYVWIPRFKYKLFNAEKANSVDYYNAKTTGIDIVFEEGTKSTGTVSCQISSTGVETCTNAVNGNYYTHPAFTFGEDELTGFWTGKYEMSNASQPKILPGMVSWIEDTVSNHYTKIKNMQSSGNAYGLSTDTTIVDSHMLKNIEYGALAYLTHSDYGRCTDDSCNMLVNTDFNPYNYSSPPITGDLNLTTTDNVYGVYDIVSSYNEFVMGNMIYSDGQTMMSGWYSSGFNSGFNGLCYGDDAIKTNGIPYPDKKYYDVYPFAESSNYIGHLGDSTSEVKGWGTSYNISPDYPWIVRGPGVGTASVFDYFYETGYDRDYYIGARAVLAVY